VRVGSQLRGTKRGWWTKKAHRKEEVENPKKRREHSENVMPRPRQKGGARRKKDKAQRRQKRESTQKFVPDSELRSGSQAEGYPKTLKGKRGAMDKRGGQWGPKKIGQKWTNQGFFHSERCQKRKCQRKESKGVINHISSNQPVSRMTLTTGQKDWGGKDETKLGWQP